MQTPQTGVRSLYVNGGQRPYERFEASLTEHYDLLSALKSAYQLWRLSTDVPHYITPSDVARVFPLIEENSLLDMNYNQFIQATWLFH
ncbi:hypothetical protein FGO68_gene9453 [Halteria grandinella]|uniref:Uncharacterized protein n=1 Tax=Halteria grandinella TaxID=5974 RepID=A0A8J8P8X3_HALGN|nr:hypothetical protein FGO68_gene9453 [Halteria grandinella]